MHFYSEGVCGRRTQFCTQSCFVWVFLKAIVIYSFLLLCVCGCFFLFGFFGLFPLLSSLLHTGRTHWLSRDPLTCLSALYDCRINGIRLR